MRILKWVVPFRELFVAYVAWLITSDYSRKRYMSSLGSDLADEETRVDVIDIALCAMIALMVVFFFLSMWFSAMAFIDLPGSRRIR